MVRSNEVTVTTQAALDWALKRKVSCIYIDSLESVRLTLSTSGESRVVALGNSRVQTWDDSCVEARDNSHVDAWGRSIVVARGSSSVVAQDNSRVVAYNDSSVEAQDRSTVEADGNSRVVAWDNSRVMSYHSSRVEAWGCGTVEARGNSHVVARGNSHVVAWDDSHVVASPLVAVHVHATTVIVEGGVVIDAIQYNNDGRSWCEFHGVTVTGGKAVLYKAVYGDWRTGRGPMWTYAPGSTVKAKDFDPIRECGQGLHLCPSPRGSGRYLQNATRYVAVEVDVDTIVPLDDKAKVPQCRVLHEVNHDGERVFR